MKIDRQGLLMLLDTLVVQTDRKKKAVQEWKEDFSDPVLAQYMQATVDMDLMVIDYLKEKLEV